MTMCVSHLTTFSTFGCNSDVFCLLIMLLQYKKLLNKCCRISPLYFLVQFTTIIYVYIHSVSVGLKNYVCVYISIYVCIDVIIKCKGNAITNIEGRCSFFSSVVVRMGHS